VQRLLVCLLRMHEQGTGMDRIPTYSEVVQRGLQPRSAPNRVPVNRLGKPPTRVTLGSPNKPVRIEKLPPRSTKHVEKKDDWEARGSALAKEFVAAVLGGDPDKMHEAFFGRGYVAETKKLYHTIDERWRPADNRPGWQSESLVKWFREAVEGCSIDELRRIGENVYDLVGAKGFLFQEARTALVFSVNERLLAHEFVKTVLRRGDLRAASARFEQLFVSAQLDDRCINQRMMMLLDDMLPKLSPDQETWLAQAAGSRAVTVLRTLLRMRDPRALETSSNG
jgi:hypothetical protein